MLNKNISSQGIYIMATNTTTLAGQEGDSANITASISLDGAASSTWNSGGNPTEIGGGVYWCGFTQAETNADSIALIPVSTTANVVIKPCVITTDGGTFVGLDDTTYSRLGNAGTDTGLPRGKDTDSLTDVGTAVWASTSRSLTEEVTANIVSILGTSITETIAGQVAEAMSNFYDVTTPTKTVNDVGVAGTSLTAEEVVTAMDADSTKLASILEDTAEIANLNNISTAQVNTEVLDVLSVDTFGEPGKVKPPVVNSILGKINYLYKSLINKKTSDGSTEKLYNSDGATVDQQATVSDDGTTATKGAVEIGS